MISPWVLLVFSFSDVHSALSLLSDGTCEARLSSLGAFPFLSEASLAALSHGWLSGPDSLRITENWGLCLQGFKMESDSGVDFYLQESDKTVYFLKPI